MCRLCNAGSPDWSSGVRVPVQELPLFFASQPSWNFEQKIYGHNVVVTNRARPTQSGQLGCHDMNGVVPRRQDHFLVREIFHCPGKRYNCSSRARCTGRRKHCYALCKVTVYSANRDVALVQYAGSHGRGDAARGLQTYNGEMLENRPLKIRKKEMKMRNIMESPSEQDYTCKQDITYKTTGSNYHSSANHPPEQQNFNDMTQFIPMTPSSDVDVSSSQIQQVGYPFNMSYSIPGYIEPIQSPDTSSEYLFQPQMMQNPQLSPYTFNNTLQHPKSTQSPPKNFWQTSGMILSPTSQQQNHFIPKVEDPSNGYGDLPQMEPKPKRRRLEEMKLTHTLTHPILSNPISQETLSPGPEDIWRPFLDTSTDSLAVYPTVREIKQEDVQVADGTYRLHHPEHLTEENLLSFVVKSEEPTFQYTDTQNLLMNLSHELQLNEL